MPAVILFKKFDEGKNVLHISGDTFTIKDMARFVTEHSAPTIIPWRESESHTVFEVGDEGPRSTTMMLRWPMNCPKYQ